MQMKATIAKTIVVATLAVALSACGNHQTNRRVGTGAAIGGLAGYVLGGDTQSAVGGAALGSIAGGVYDHVQNKKEARRNEDRRREERRWERERERYDRHEHRRHHRHHFDDDDD
jgi:17 kDa surface antigen